LEDTTTNQKDDDDDVNHSTSLFLRQFDIYGQDDIKEEKGDYDDKETNAVHF
jgi:hypothetical protein